MPDLRLARAVALVSLASLVACSEPEAPTFVVVTFNAGTNPGLPHDDPPDDGYTSAEAALSDQYYGDGLAWKPVIEDTRAFLVELEPDVIGFQEMFHTAECPSVPPEAQAGFACEGWQPDDPTVAQLVLGAGYQVMCHVGHLDKCVAVRRAFGTFRGCDRDRCDEGAFGTSIAGCGSGARVGRAVIELVDGGELTLVNVHGTSGFTTEDQQCRAAQVDQVFVDLGDGAPAASGATNVIVGDLNTDPERLEFNDAGARRWREHVGVPGDDRSFHFISAIDEAAPPTYSGLFNIDHVMSDRLGGDCWAAGVTPGHPAVTASTYYDHVPVVCLVERP